jgi:AraC-like DNA-binding protein
MLLDAGLRGGAIALFCLLALGGLRQARVPSARYSAVFDICAMAYLLETAPGLRDLTPWILPVRILSNATPGIFVVWSQAAFDDSFRPKPWRWLPFLLMAALGTWAVVADTRLPWLATQAGALACTASGIAIALAGRSEDLIESRRRARLVFACALGACIAFATLTGALQAPPLPAITAVLAIALAASLLRTPIDPLPAPDAAPIQAGPPPPAMDSEERALLDRLTRAMEQDRLYREGGLTVALLADRLGVPEYRLRRLINQRLGHRNFAAYVNSYRLREAQSALADPAQARVPVLTIALDAGFQSIGPFNRAFKALTGETPTDYRKRGLTDSNIGQVLPETASHPARPPARASGH